MRRALGGRRGHLSAAARASRDASAQAYEEARRKTFLRVYTLWAGQLFLSPLLGEEGVFARMNLEAC